MLAGDDGTNNQGNKDDEQGEVENGVANNTTLPQL